MSEIHIVHGQSAKQTLLLSDLVTSDCISWKRRWKPHIPMTSLSMGQSWRRKRTASLILVAQERQGVAKRKLAYTAGMYCKISEHIAPGKLNEKKKDIIRIAKTTIPAPCSIYMPLPER